MEQFDFSKEPGRKLLRPCRQDKIEPLVSIITPYYNAGKYFEQTFNCVINQTFPWFEWIIVDDGSTDEESLNILKRFAALDSRIKVFHKENGGIASARNAGIEASKAEIVIPLDGDDLIIPTFTELLYWALLEHPEAAWAYTDTVGFGADEYLWIKKFSAMRMKTENLLVCTAAIRKSVLVKVGCYQMLAKHFNEDWYLWLNLLSRGMFPIHVGVFGFWYRRHNQGVLTIVKENKEIRQKAQSFIQDMAKMVTREVPYIEYPRVEQQGQFCSPVYREWKERVHQTHDKTNLLLLLPWMEMGGADLFNLHVVQRLNRERFSLGIVTTLECENLWQGRFEECADEVYTLPRFLNQQSYLSFLSYYIQTREVDVLFLSNSYESYYLLPWLRAHFPSLTIIDYVHMEEWYWRNGGYARLSAAMGDVIDHTYVCNERTRGIIANDMGRGLDSVDTLYIGVDTEEFDPNQVQEGLAREELCIEDNRPIVLFPCRLHPQKRPFLMLEIAQWLKKSRPDVAFVVVGDGPLLEELQTETKERRLENTVYFTGAKRDVRPYYRDAAAVLICSIKEGLALTAYEALSMATPVVTSDVGGQAELVNEETGIVLPMLQDEARDIDNRNYPAMEVAQYVDALERLLGNQQKYEQMCRRCRERVLESFSVDKMIHRLEQIFVEQCTNPSAVARRREMAENLSRTSRLVDEVVTLGTEYALLTRDANQVWAEKERLCMTLEAIQAERAGAPVPVVYAAPDTSAAEQELAYLKSTRSYRLMCKYMYFMDHTAVGRFLSKIRDLLTGRKGGTGGVA